MSSSSLPKAKRATLPSSCLEGHLPAKKRATCDDDDDKRAIKKLKEYSQEMEAKIKGLEAQVAQLNADAVHSHKKFAKLVAETKLCPVCLQLPTLPVIVCPCMTTVCGPCVGHQVSIVNQAKYGYDHNSWPIATPVYPLKDEYKCPNCGIENSKATIMSLNSANRGDFYLTDLEYFVHPHPTVCTICKSFKNPDPRLLALHTTFCLEGQLPCPHCNVKVGPGEETDHLEHGCHSFKCNLYGCLRTTSRGMTGGELRKHMLAHAMERDIAARLRRATDDTLGSILAFLYSERQLAGDGNDRKVLVSYLTNQTTCALHDSRGCAVDAPSPDHSPTYVVDAPISSPAALSFNVANSPSPAGQHMVPFTPGPSSSSSSSSSAR